MATTTTQTTAAELVSLAIENAERSQKWVAEKSGISATTMHRKLRGGTDFTVSEVARIAKALAIHPAELLPEPFARPELADAAA